MNEQELDPRVKGVEKALKYGGAVVVAVVASTAVIASAGSVIVAGIALTGAIATINFLPVFARWAALKKQQGLTKLAEEFSEETIREDERKEGERIGILEDSYKKNRAELEGAQEVLREQLETAKEDEHDMVQAQINALQSVINNAEATLLQRKADYEELKRVNGLYIALHRSAEAMEKSEGAERNPQQLQDLKTARESIKTRMRAAMAGKTIEAMDNQFRQKPNLVKIAQLGNSRPLTVPTEIKEVNRVPSRS
jgi:hypothetical protein